jgi:hypothetical protein
MTIPSPKQAQSLRLHSNPWISPGVACENITVDQTKNTNEARPVGLGQETTRQDGAHGT